MVVSCGCMREDCGICYDLTEEEMNNKEELLPCPFCGEEEDLSIRVSMHHGMPIELEGLKFWRVECLPCDCRTGNNFDGDAEAYGFSSGREMAIDAWNRREG